VRVKLPAGADGALARGAATADALTAQVLEELNVKALEVIPDESEMVERTLYPLLPVIGPRHGRSVGAVMAGARSGDWRLLDDGRAEVGGVMLASDEFQLTARARPGHEVAEEGDLLVALDTQLDDALADEGLAREVAHRLQNLRKAAGYEISDRISVAIVTDSVTAERLQPFRDWLAAETLATSLDIGAEANQVQADRDEEITLDGTLLHLAVERAS
jgi:isoleucyl-tRNA synthetase